MKSLIPTLGIASLCAIPVFAQSAGDRAAAREIIAKHGPAVVVVLGGLKVHANIDGQDSPVQDIKIQSNAVVLDRSGLIAMPLFALDPTDTASSVLGAVGSRLELTSESSDLRIRFGDGREVPARIALRDRDLDIALLRPTNPLEKPAAALDGPTAKPSVMDAVVGLRRYDEIVDWQVGATVGYVQLLIDRPRAMYVVTTDGSAVFDVAGKFIGMLVVKHVKPTVGAGNPFDLSLFTGGASRLMEAMGLLPVVLPADDIRALATKAIGK